MTTGETPVDGPPPVTWMFPGKYISLTTYRRDGTAVATPVWFVQEGDRLLVRTGAASGKVKRIHRDPAVRVAVCTARGRLRGQPVSGVARVLSGSEADAAERLISRKYRAGLMIIRSLWFIQSALHPGRPRSKPAILAITPR
ncbi:MAG: PPOX class F420-dependent oxidoreductase [Streptosporangiaceae bacterium]|jgi:PPOX class probable F420-dependent enzyme